MSRGGFSPTPVAGGRVADPAPTASVEQIAKLFGLTDRRVQQLAKAGIIPKPSRGRYHFLGSIRGYIKYQQELAEAAANKARQPLVADVAAQQARKLSADARKSEIEVELLERRVVKVEDADAIVAKLLTDLRSAILPFPRVASPRLLGAKTVQELEQRLEAQVARLLDQLAAPSFGDEDTGTQESAA
jgi:phage terminase Nu1 subunit (DNA packaging protein)